MSDWRRTAKTIGTTFLVTSAGWLIAGAILFERHRQQSPTRAEARIERASGAVAASSREARASIGRLLIPVAGVSRSHLIDTFTQAREDGQRGHDAIDIMAPLGTPVVAAAAGTVEKLFLSTQGGNTIYVRSSDRRIVYYYAHLDRYVPGLAVGQRVVQGQALGTVGYSGNASPDGPHLHFAILGLAPEAKWWGKGVALNPYPLLRGR